MYIAWCIDEVEKCYKIFKIGAGDNPAVCEELGKELTIFLERIKEWVDPFIPTSWLFRIINNLTATARVYTPN